MKRSILPAGILLAALSGCASLELETAAPQVEGLLAERGRPGFSGSDTAAARELLAEFPQRELGIADAVRLALVNNPELSADYSRLGFAAAEVYDAGRLSNPVLSASLLVPDVGGESDQVGFGLAQGFTELLLLPARRRFAEAEFESAKLELGAKVLELAADTESAWYRLAGASQVLAMREAVAEAADAGAALAGRFFAAGNINRLELAEQQAAASQAQLDVLEARAEASAARSALNRLLGLAASEDRWRIAERLPAPLVEQPAESALFALADRSRLDLAAARVQAGALADQLGVTRRTRLLGETEIELETERETDRTRLSGGAIALELPIFNQGRGRVARAEAALAEAEAGLRELEIAISNDVRLALAELDLAQARAAHYRDSLIPLRETIVARTQEEVNFMLEGQFRLLEVKQQEYEAYQGYLEAVRDYWLARVELARSVGAALPASAATPAEEIDARSLITPDAGGQHMHHGSGSDVPGNMDHSTHSGAMDHSTHSGGMDRTKHGGGVDHSKHTGGKDHSEHTGGTDHSTHTGGMDHSKHGGGMDHSTQSGGMDHSTHSGGSTGGEMDHSMHAPQGASGMDHGAHAPGSMQDTEKGNQQGAQP